MVSKRLFIYMAMIHKMAYIQIVYVYYLYVNLFTYAFKSMDVCVHEREKDFAINIWSAQLRKLRTARDADGQVGCRHGGAHCFAAVCWKSKGGLMQLWAVLKANSLKSRKSLFLIFFTLNRKVEKIKNRNCNLKVSGS